ncbi:hypothetical protein [Flagellimonas sp. S3867]|uniref:hypothetical protein n=1 Tax=Flagellimonas sp. S3867 TaxID=2768063 RepID=UPI0016821899|nr:hypothetical protein [Flagellimonas sp. S3867]
MKTTTLILLVLLTCLHSLIAQKTEATILFKNGEVLTGLAKFKGEEKIIFRKTKKSEKQVFELDLVDTLKVHQKERSITYTQVRIKDSEKPKVLEMVSTGEKATLFRKISVGYNPGVPAPGGYGTGAIPTHYSISSSYVRKAGEDEAVYLGNNQLFSKNFKKGATELFQDCPSLIKKIENKEYKKKDIKDIIEFYNNECN